MARKKKQSSSSKAGYGIHNVCKQKVTKKNLNVILDKKWKDVASYDLYILYNKGWKTVDIQAHYRSTLTAVLNRLRSV